VNGVFSSCPNASDPNPSCYLSVPVHQKSSAEEAVGSASSRLQCIELTGGPSRGNDPSSLGEKLSLYSLANPTALSQVGRLAAEEEVMGMRWSYTSKA